jgi:5-methyltetrahydrofolate--homocysteine methyltransferase
MMHKKMDEIIKSGAVVTDGSWGTQMVARGLKRGESPDSWNLIHPGKVLDVASSYVSAGSRIILTNTFGANRIVLEKVGLADRAPEINEKGAALSKEAAGNKALVFGSIGPCGKILMTGDVTESELENVFREQAGALARGGVDGLVIETMMDLAEMKIALGAAKETGLPVVASMVYDSGKQKDRTMMGHTPEEAAEVLTAEGADAVGANCGQGIEGFLPICRRLKEATILPIWIKPNAGLPETVDGRTVYKTTPKDFVAYVPELLDAGATFLGGCCGTNHEFVQAIARLIHG